MNYSLPTNAILLWSLKMLKKLIIEIYYHESKALVNLLKKI